MKLGEKMIIQELDGAESKKQYINHTFFKKGGMGEIYKSFDIVNNKDVAIKIIQIIDPDDEELLNRELIASKSISGNNIVNTNYVSKTKINGMEFFYIVQDFYEKGNMRGIIQNNIDIDICFSMMTDILLGLKSAHQTIIHRDLKPENILIDDNDRLVITDFGLAKFINEKTRTRSFKGAGTIPYMAPECWLFEENLIPMDIYSAGIIFYEIICGKLPIEAKTESEWKDFHLYQQLPDILKIRNDIPVKLKAIIEKMVKKRSQERYSNVEEILSALGDAIKQKDNKKIGTEQGFGKGIP